MMEHPIHTEGQHCMKSNNTAPIRLTVFIFVFLAVVGGCLLWWNDATAPFDQVDNTPISFTVAKGDTISEISSNLSSARLIRSRVGFYIVVKLMGLERQIQAGEFRLNRTMDTKTIAEALTHGMTDTWVTILEGWRIEEIATKLAKELDIPEKEFLTIAQEGMMFPDTYRIPKDASAGAIVALFKENFSKKITPQMQQDMQEKQLTVQDVLILASIVEREGKTAKDRPVIAGILLNRLENGWPLETDATVQYALGYQPNEKTWWKKTLSNEDKYVDSPYNTYVNQGLPPFPIANPGTEAIMAVIYPVKTDYMFYLHDPTGAVHYAKTLEEHEKNIEQYL